MIEFDEEVLADDEFLALEQAMLAAESQATESQVVEVAAHVQRNDLHGCNTASLPASMPGAATAAAGTPSKDAALLQQQQKQQQQQHRPPGASPARWGGLGLRAAALRGVAVLVSSPGRVSQPPSQSSASQSSQPEPGGPATQRSSQSGQQSASTGLATTPAPDELAAVEHLEAAAALQQRLETPAMPLPPADTAAFGSGAVQGRQQTPQQQQQPQQAAAAQLTDQQRLVRSWDAELQAAQGQVSWQISAAAVQQSGVASGSSLNEVADLTQDACLTAADTQIASRQSQQEQPQQPQTRQLQQQRLPGGSEKRAASTPTGKRPGKVKPLGKLQLGSPIISVFKGTDGQALLLPNPKRSVSTSALPEGGSGSPGEDAAPKKKRGRPRKDASQTAAAKQKNQQQQQSQSQQMQPSAQQSAPQAAIVLPDLEDAGLVMDRLSAFRRKGMVVTDFTQSEWCQQQVAYGLTARIPKEELETDAMRAGTAKHAALEAETTVAVQVEVATWEDYWAVRLLNSVAALRQLAAEGLTREVFVFGLIKGRWVRGIIDQLQLDERGQVQVVEHKTRARPTLPRPEQARTTKLQVALYRLMLLRLPKLTDAQMDIFLREAVGVNPVWSLSGAVAAHAAQLTGQPTSDLRQVAALLRQSAQLLSQENGVDAAMFVNYWWQGDGEIIETVEVEAEAEWLAESMDRHLSFWSGAAPPATVGPQESWKCRFCAFQHSCPAGRRFAAG